MFQPNAFCTLRLRGGRDKYGQERLLDPIEIGYAPVNMNITADKTSVRSDSSASRGQAEEMTSRNAKILVPAGTIVKHGDQVDIDGESFRVSGRHVRKSVFGVVDHIELLLEAWPA